MCYPFKMSNVKYRTLQKEAQIMATNTKTRINTDAKALLNKSTF